MYSDERSHAVVFNLKQVLLHRRWVITEVYFLFYARQTIRLQVCFEGYNQMHSGMSGVLSKRFEVRDKGSEWRCFKNQLRNALCAFVSSRSWRTEIRSSWLSAFGIVDFMQNTGRRLPSAVTIILKEQFCKKKKNPQKFIYTSKVDWPRLIWCGKLSLSKYLTQTISCCYKMMDTAILDNQDNFFL